jgi:tyrosine-protein phosphatase SIW14
MKGTKKQEIPIKTMKAILRLVLDRQNHPLLIHCNHGRVRNTDPTYCGETVTLTWLQHRTGCVIAIVRKVSGWELDKVLDEYRRFAAPKEREADVSYITNFELASLSNLFNKDTSVHFRVRNFIQATFFAMVVLIIWLVSGNKLAAERNSIDQDA